MSMQMTAAVALALVVVGVSLFQVPREARGVSGSLAALWLMAAGFVVLFPLVVFLILAAIGPVIRAL